jgi:BASS family bile acid:Na+ symporter
MQEFADIFMPLSIALIMFGIGLELCFDDFRRVFIDPRAIITGLASQLFLLPLVAFALVFFWPIEPIYKIGIMLLAACPGGTTSNLVTKMLGGRVALSVSLTGFNSFIILLSIPLIIQFSYAVFGENGQEVSLNFLQTVKNVSYTVILPVIGGVLLNQYFGHKFGTKLHKVLRYLLPGIMLLAFFVVIFIDDSQQNIDYLAHINLLIPLFILNIVTIFSGYAVARRLHLKHTSAYTIAIEMGLQNSVLALFIANSILQDKNISLVAILYSSFSLISTFLIAWILKRYFGKRKERQIKRYNQ